MSLNKTKRSVHNYCNMAPCPRAVPERCPIHPIQGMEDRNVYPFEGSKSNFDEKVDQASPTQRLIAPHCVHAGSNYGSIQENINREALPSDTNVQSSEINSPTEKLPFVFINIIAVLMSASARFQSPVMSQYLYQRFADELLGNDSRSTSSNPCLTNASADSATAVRKVQEMTSEMLMYLQLSNYSMGIPACLLLGVYANTLSRKLLLFIPVFGYFVKSVVIAAVVFCHMHLNWFFLGFAVDGILGNMCGFYFGAFLYTSDITSRGRTRTTSLSIVEGLQGFVVAGINSVTGQLIKRTGCLVPAILSTCCVVLSLLGVLLLPNRKPPSQLNCSEDNVSHISRFCRILSTPFSTTFTDIRVRKLVIIGGVAFFLALIVSVGISKIETLYIMNMPFCFDAAKVGWYMFGKELAYNGFLIIAVPLIYSCLPGMWLGILGSGSVIFVCVMYILATTDVAIYHIIFLSIGQLLPVNMIRGETSRLFSSEFQGPLFAILATLECIAFSMGTSALYVYRVSLDIYKGLVFAVFVAVMVVVAILLLFYQVIWKHHQLKSLVKELRQKYESRLFSPT